MRWSNLLLLLVSVLTAYAQDPVPGKREPNVVFHTAQRLWERSDTIPYACSLPVLFQGTGQNEITGESGLSVVFPRLHTLRSRYAADSLHIVHIGDSHVRGKIFPETAGEELNLVFGTIRYTHLGINGATCLTFTKNGRTDEIAALEPDLLILSFGTNESHSRAYNSREHYRQMALLYRLIREQLPDTPLLLTTPPGSFERVRGNKKRVYTNNIRTKVAAETIREFASDHQLAVWDIYHIAGGVERACTNWKAAGLMRPDHVHYMPEGYSLQGKLLSEAIIKAYNRYVLF